MMNTQTNNNFLFQINPINNELLKCQKKKKQNSKIDPIIPYLSKCNQSRFPINLIHNNIGKLMNTNLNPNIYFNVIQNTNFFLKKKARKFKKVRTPFSKEEDEQIIKLVEQYGSNQWGNIASHIKGRTPKQCRDRYSNYLAPGIFKCQWTNAEDELLIKLYQQIGPKWSILQKSFPGRSSGSVKNRWKYFLCKQTLKIFQNHNNLFFNPNNFFNQKKTNYPHLASNYFQEKIQIQNHPPIPSTIQMNKEVKNDTIANKDLNILQIDESEFRNEDFDEYDDWEIII